MFNIQSQKAGRNIVNVGSTINIGEQDVNKDLEGNEKVYNLMIIDVSIKKIIEIKKRLDGMNLKFKTS